MNAAALIEAAPAVACQPWPRHVLPPAEWAAMAAALAESPIDLVALWADTAQVHALFGGKAPLLASTPVVAGAYAALSPACPAAAPFERMVRDLWGHVAGGGVDGRALLDHGCWEAARPMSQRPGPPATLMASVLRPGPAGLHQVPLGPVLPGIAEPVHWRLHAAGEAVRGAQARLGYAHKGILALMRGKPPRAAARFAARLAGDATVAHGTAFAQAAEAALGIEAPARALALRAVLAALERLAAVLGNLAALCGAAGFGFGEARFGLHRERVARACGTAFGHRLLMDLAVPGGVAGDLLPGGMAAILAALPEPEALAALYPGALAERLGGFGRAGAGDCDGRARRWLAEAGTAAARLPGLLQGLPGGPLTVALPPGSGEGIGVAASVRGDVWHWLRLDGGMVGAAFAADPGWRLWPMAEVALQDGGLADAEVILRSFALSASAVDL